MHENIKMYSGQNLVRGTDFDVMNTLLETISQTSQVYWKQGVNIKNQYLISIKNVFQKYTHPYNT